METAAKPYIDPTPGDHRRAIRERTGFQSVRSIYLLAGLVMTGFGIAGVFLPLLPTTPFLLAAIWFFSRSSPRLEHWLLNHPRLGPPLRDWQRDGAISARAKIMALALMATSFAFFMVSRSPSLPVATIVGAILCTSALFIATRPLPKKDR